MSDSKLVVYKKISPNKSVKRNHKIDTITIHCMAGNLTIEQCGDLFANPKYKASSNYGIDSKGRIGLYVNEQDRSWASSNRANDERAITIEVANDGGKATGWHVSDKAMKSLIELLVDICKRNDIKELKWKANKLLIGQVDKQNMTVHRWFANKDCPGDYLYNKHTYIANEVNKKLKYKKDLTKPSTDLIIVKQGAKYKSNNVVGTYVTTSELNLRRGASTNYYIETVIPKGKEVKCYGYYNINKHKKWLYVTYGKYIGYVHSDYLKKKG